MARPVGLCCPSDYSEPAFSPYSSPELTEEYPFILTTGARTYAFFHSEHRQIPILRELNPDALIEINPEDAHRLGVADGQWVEIANGYGKAKFKAKLSPIVKVGVVQAQHGWWFPEQDPRTHRPLRPRAWQKKL
jgi:anaerobic selenocysteine-containing dehydrogenase